MKKEYSILEIIAKTIDFAISLLIISNCFLNFIPINYQYGFIIGIWSGWFITRNYHKNKMQSNTQKERK